MLISIAGITFSIPELVLGGLLILYVIVGLVRGAKNGVGRTLHRMVAAVVSAVISCLIFTYLFQNLPGFLLEKFHDQIMSIVPADYQPLLTDEDLRGLVQVFLSMVLSPVLFFLFFSINRGLLRLITFFFSRKKKKRGPSFIGALLGIVLGAFVFCVAYTPVIGLMQSADTVVTNLLASEDSALDENTQATLANIDENVLRPINKSKYVNMVMDNGGNFLFSKLTTVTVSAGVTTNLKDELNAYEKLYENGVAISQLDLANCSDEDAAVLNEMAVNIDASPFLKHASAVVLNKLCTKWQNGEKFLGVEAPLADETSETAEVQNELIKVVLKIFATSTDDTVIPDLKTLVSMIEIARTNHVFENMDSRDELLNSFAKEGFVSSLVTELGKNTHMNLLIPELTNISIRLLADALDIPGNYEEVYHKLMENVASDYNAVMALPEEERGDALAEKIKTSLTNNGIDASDSVAYLLSDALLNDFSDLSAITADDAAEFFAAYAAAAGGDTTASGDIPGNDTASNGDLFETLADTEPKRTFSHASDAGKLTAAVEEIVRKNENPDAEALKKAIADFYGEGLSAVIGDRIVSEAQDGKFTGGNAPTLTSPEDIQSSLVVMKDLLIDAEAAAGKLTAESAAAEGAAIEKAVSAMKTVYNTLSASEGKISADNVSDTIRSLGAVLDALSSTQSVGADSTAGLLTAILQSDKVCESTGLDKATTAGVAQTIVSNASGEGASYTEIMNTVGDAAHVVLISQDKNTTNEDRVDSFQKMIFNLTSASVKTVYDLVDSSLLSNYGLTPERQALASTSIHKVLDKLVLVRKDVSEEEFKKEATSVNTLISLVVDTDRNGLKELFSTDEDNHLVNDSAEETVHMLLDSTVCMETLNEMTRDQNGNAIADPFGLGKFMSDAAKAKVTEVCKSYYEENLPADRAEQEAFCRNLNAILIAFCMEEAYQVK